MSAAARSLSLVSPVVTSGMELRLQCPRCGSPLGVCRRENPNTEVERSCAHCAFRMTHQEGIWKALPPEREAYYARFMHEYRTVREAEGRGSADPEYYLALPYRDLSGHNREQWLIRSRSYGYFELTILPEIEARLKGDLHILDLGAGNGWMSYRLAMRRHLPVAVDVLASEMDGLAAAAHYRRRLPTLFPRFQAELDHLPFADNQFDLAIFNASFHYSEDYRATLGEAIRCLRPGGWLVIADTAWYRHDRSGQRMLAERHNAFTARYGFASDSIASMEYLTDVRLGRLEEAFGIRWTKHSPFYGVRWAMRPLIAKLRRKREPSRFRIYMAEVGK